MVSFDSTLCK